MEELCLEIYDRAEQLKRLLDELKDRVAAAELTDIGLLAGLLVRLTDTIPVVSDLIASVPQT